MKRSDMIDYIETRLWEVIASYRYASELQIPYEVRNAAGGMLDMVEELGMLPPHTSITGTKDELEGHIQNCQWEPENAS